MKEGRKEGRKEEKKEMQARGIKLLLIMSYHDFCCQSLAAV
jgi:hypothetical protein